MAPAPGRSASGASAATARPHPTAPVADDADAPPPFTDDDAPPPFDDDGDAHPFDTAPTPGGERASMPAGATASSSRPAADGAPPSAGSGPAGRAAPATPRPSEANAPAQAADAPAASERSAAAESTASTAASASPAHDMTRPASTDATSSADDPSPLEPVAPTPPATPVGPIELGHVRDAWPEVLGQLQVASRSSWLVVSTATVAAFEAEVLTLAFRTSADLAAFKTRTPEGGPSEDLRQAIQAVLGVRVKYLARLEGDGGPGGSPRRPGDGSPAGPGAARSAGPTASAPRTASSSAPYASSVTEWAVAPIPTSDGGAPTALAVDDEPDDAVVEPTRIAPHAGAVLPPREVAPSVPAPDEVDDDDVIPPADETEAPLPPVVVPRMAPLRGGVQRYGEAVVRQMLGATYVRDEPYEPPTRFS